MGVVILFLFRLLYVIFRMCIIIVVVPIVIVVGLFWTFNPKKVYGWIKEDFNDPFEEEDIIRYLGKNHPLVKEYYIYQTSWDYLFLNKEWIYNKNYDPDYLKPKTKSKLIDPESLKKELSKAIDRA